MGETNDPVPIDDEIAAELVWITLDTMKPPARRELPDIVPKNRRCPRPKRGPLQSIGPVYAAVLIEQQWKRSSGLAKPGPRPPLNTERHDQYLGVEVRELIGVVAQLCHVLTARQSAQMAEKYQKGVPAARRGLAQRMEPAGDGRKTKVRGEVSGPDDHASPFQAPRPLPCSPMAGRKGAAARR